jgi:predicted MFS family arabinose efflux permease
MFGAAQNALQRDGMGDGEQSGAARTHLPLTVEVAQIGRAELTGLVGLVTGVQAFATLAVLALPTLAPKAAIAYGVGAEIVGYQISLTYISAALLSSFAGVFVRRHGAARISSTAVLLGAAGLTGLASGNLVIAALASVVIGLAYGLTNPSASHLLWRFGPSRRRNLIFALKQTGVPLGGMLAALLLPTLSERLGWQGAMLVATSFCLALAMPLWLMRRRWDDDRDPAARIQGALLAGLRMMFSSRRLLALSVMGWGYASAQLCLLSFLVTMLVQDLGWSLVAAGGMATLMQIGGVTGRVFWSILADRTGRGIDILIFLGIAAAACALTVAMVRADWPVAALAALLFAFGFCLVGWNGLYMAEVARASTPENVSVATGGVLVFNFAGIVLGPAAFATVYKIVGSYALTYGIFAVLPLIGAAALLPVRRPEQAHR